MTGTASTERALPVREARVAGLCYLFVIGSGVFAALFVRDALFAPGDAVSTARAIAANEDWWRAGIAIHLLYLPAGAAVAVILYRLFRHVHASLALVAAVLSLCDVAIETMLLTFLYVPLILSGDSAVAAFAEGQRQAMSYLAVRLFMVGWGFALLLFSGFCVIIGTLIWRSRLIPRPIGVLMILAGASYFANTLAGILAPGLATALLPWILIPPFIGELSLAVWLSARGVRAPGVPTR